MSVNVLIVNVHSAMNAGDLALLQMTIQLLKERFQDARFLISANYPEEAAVKNEGDVVVASPWYLAGGTTSRKPRILLLHLFLGWLLALSKLYKIPLWRKTGWAKLFDAYQKADLVVAVSGNQFFSSGKRGWPLLAVAMSVDLARLFKKPVYIMPQSVGPFRYGWEYQLLKRSYSRGRIVFLRDYQSLQTAKSAGLPEAKVLFAPDPAFALRPAAPVDAASVLSKYGYVDGIPSIGVTVIASMPSYLDRGLMDLYYEKTAQALCGMIETYGCHVFFFYQVCGPSTHEDDRIATQTVVGKMQHLQEKVHVVSEVLDPAVLKACYGRMDLFLASRLHSGIFSMGMGVPTVLIGYLHKTLGVLQALGLQENVIELRDLKEKDVFPVLEKIWLEKDVQRQYLRKQVETITQQVQTIGASIAADFGE